MILNFQPLSPTQRVPAASLSLPALAEASGSRTEAAAQGSAYS
jgi:hypothetical protein